MTDSSDEFAKLLGSHGIKKIKPRNQSPDFYQPKPQNNGVDRRQLAESFLHSPISMADYDIGVEDRLSFRREGVQNYLFNQLARGELTVYESIDLHGMTTLEAEIYMSQTIVNQYYPHMTCIRIVHGKGYNVGDSAFDKPAPKLKNFTARYLAEHPRVLAYVSCPVHRGGTGAVYVLLSRHHFE